MTVTLLIDQHPVRLDNSLFQTSDRIKDALADLQQDDIELEIPPQYWSVIDIYLEFIGKIYFDDEGKVVYPNDLPVISDIKTLLLCFDMESFFADHAFFIYLMGEAYTLWSEFFPRIRTLPDERLAYLYSPYEFVPEEYRQRPAFFKEWLSINANKEIVLNGDEVYHTFISYYDDNLQRQFKHWRTCKDGKLDGIWEAWYENGQLEYQRNYKNGKQDGLYEEWYEDGQLRYRHNYKDGKQDGVREAWYENGQPEYQHNYKDDQQDGLQKGWYADGRPRYIIEFKMGRRIYEKYF